MNDQQSQRLSSLCQAFLLLESEQEVLNFLKDLCTPNELNALTERWLICQTLSAGLSYREIHARTGASLTTVGRVARFLKDESYGGYANLLSKLSTKNIGGEL